MEPFIIFCLCVLRASVVNFFFIAIFISVIFTGCGKRREPVYPVHGQILCQGNPAVNALVIFHPKGGSEEVMKMRPHGRVDTDRRFTLTTYQPGDGAPAGEYNVTVVWPGPAPGASVIPGDEESGMSGPDRLKGWYKNPESSGLLATVVKGKNTLNPFDLE